ncbi:serine hydrolase domain-containing protein [Pelagibius litoralis]|uniref:serine hydrolase domain-containing protein n=1 Tax=Pelagibius litoralis TaxID=374515 RepID=UPI00197F899F|nr:serine hydrolase [Pelagibius litoralis]
MLPSGHAASAAEWPLSSLTEAGFAAETGDLLDRSYAAGALSNLHGVVVIRGGKLVLERYFEGEDEVWGTPLGPVVFGPKTLHDLRSVSKSVVSLLYGIALAEGKVPPLDTPLVDLFDYPDLAADDARRRIMVKHALTMTLGLAWDESLPYSDPRNSEIAMEMADDRYRYILERPIIAEPGTKWTYSGGSTALLAHLISRGSGKPLIDVAREKLFAPLGITRSSWTPGLNGEAAAASGLRLTARDLARIGQMVLNQGRWGDRQVVPEDWLRDSFIHHVPSEDSLFYGYQWWLGKGSRDGRNWIAGFGNGGQRLVVIPDLDLVLVVLAGDYNQRDAWKISVRIMTEILFPSIREP